MINLTTYCRKPDTVATVLTTLLGVALTVFLPTLQDHSNGTAPLPDHVSILERVPDVQQTTTALNQPSVPNDPFSGTNAAGSFSSGLFSDPSTQPGPTYLVQDALVPPSEDTQQLEPPAEDLDVMMRGPLHEAFADVHQADPVANPILTRQPPEPINEVAPEFKPEGDNVQWITGYWAWDDEQQDYIWVSGVWRDVPPNQRWIPGYWSEDQGGFRWVSGFWTALQQEELNYVPEPPASLDQGPSVAAPGDDYFYCPGNWEYLNSQFVWRSGHWQPRVSNWIWIPARFIWTPRGCIYRPGYWDYEFEYRGTAFAPVYFHRPIYRGVRFRYCPSYSINTGVNFFVHLFVRRNCSHYYYGNWYGRTYGGYAYRPWVSPASHFRHYDPLLAHYNCRRYRHGGHLFISWVNHQHQHYHQHRQHRPRPTVRAHDLYVKTRGGHPGGKPGGRNSNFDDHVDRAKLARKFRDEVDRKPGHPDLGPARRDGRPARQHRFTKVNVDDQQRQRDARQAQVDIVRARKTVERKKQAQSQPKNLPTRNSRNQIQRAKTNPAVAQKIQPGKRSQQTGNANSAGNRRSAPGIKDKIGTQSTGRQPSAIDRLKLPKSIPAQRGTQSHAAQQIKQAQREREQRRHQQQADAARQRAAQQKQQRDAQRRQTVDERKRAVPDSAKRATGNTPATRQPNRKNAAQNLNTRRNQADSTSRQSKQPANRPGVQSPRSNLSTRQRADQRGSAVDRTKQQPPKKSNGIRRQPKQQADLQKVETQARQRADAQRQAALQRAKQQSQQRTAQRQEDSLAKQRADAQRRAATRTAENRNQQQALHRARQQAEQRSHQQAEQRAAQQQADKMARQRADAQRRAASQAADRGKQQALQRARQQAQQREAQRQTDRMARQQADAQRRARDAQAKANRDASRRAAQQKAAADAQRRAAERAQRDAQRRSQQSAKRAADQARQRQRQQEQANRRANRTKGK